MRRVSSVLWAAAIGVVWIGAIESQTPQPPAGRGTPAGRGATPVPGGRGGPAPVPRKHLLVVGMTRGYHHGSTSNALATFWKLGKDSGVWDTEIKTDMEWITKKPPSSEAHSIEWFDAVAFVNTTASNHSMLWAWLEGGFLVIHSMSVLISVSQTPESLPSFQKVAKALDVDPLMVTPGHAHHEQVLSGYRRRTSAPTRNGCGAAPAGICAPRGAAASAIRSRRSKQRLWPPPIIHSILSAYNLLFETGRFILLFHVSGKGGW